MGPMNPRMPMMPQHQNMMHQMHPGQQPGQPGPGQGQGQGQQGQSSPARASPMSHASPMGGNHPSPHMQQTHMASPNMGMPMGQQQPNSTNPAKNDDYNLDFLDSIPNDENSDNAPNNAGGQGQGQQQANNEDDLMTLLDA